MSDRETIEVYDKKAGDYADLVSRDKPDQDLRRFMDALPEGAKVLDWGCGPANSAAMIRTAGFDVTASDASAEMVKFAKEEFDIDVRHESFDELNDVDTYDGIWCNFALLHAGRADFPRYLKAAHSALKPEGIFHIGMKLGEGEERDSIGRFYTYYSLDELKQHLVDAGFTITFERDGVGTGLSGQVDPYAIILSHA